MKCSSSSKKSLQEVSQIIWFFRVNFDDSFSDIQVNSSKCCRVHQNLLRFAGMLPTSRNLTSGKNEALFLGWWVGDPWHSNLKIWTYLLHMHYTALATAAHRRPAGPLTGDLFITMRQRSECCRRSEKNRLEKIKKVTRKYLLMR